MNYDLTPFLTTVAAASASIVAILGGFIASKLIAINGERNAILDKLNSIDEELRYKQDDCEARKRENDSNDALVFIRDHIKYVCEQVDLNTIYDSAENYGITKETLEFFWNKALSISKELAQTPTEKIEFNSDDLPKKLASKYLDDAFAYQVLQELIRYIKKIIKEEERKQQKELQKKDILSSFLPDPIEISAITDPLDNIRPITFTWNYSQNEQEIAKLTSDISYLLFQKKQLQEQQKLLAQPKGMKTGLVIFALFATVCIIVPLAMSPYCTDDFNEFCATKNIILILFIVGLSSIFGYLSYLLRWKEHSH